MIRHCVLFFVFPVDNCLGTHYGQEENTDTISVEPLLQLREPFSPHDRPQRPLSHLLKATAPGTIAARSDLCRPHTRALVDVYAFIGEEQNGYELVVSSLDLMSFLWGQDMRLTLAPGDVKDATAPVSAATQSSNEVCDLACIFHGQVSSAGHLSAVR